MEKIGTKGPYVRVRALTNAPRQENWKPFAIKLPFLVSIALLCLLYITLLEILVHKSTPLPEEAWIGFPTINLTTASATKMARAPVATVPLLIARDSGMMDSTCTATTTVAAVLTVVISGTFTGIKPLPVAPSRSCVATRTITVTIIQSTSSTPVTMVDTPKTTFSGPPTTTTARSSYSTPVTTVGPSKTTYISLFTTTTASGAYLTPVSIISHPITPSSAKPATCTTISTVYVTVTITVSGSVSLTSIQSGPSKSCAVTSSVTMIKTVSAYLTPVTTLPISSTSEVITSTSRDYLNPTSSPTTTPVITLIRTTTPIVIPLMTTQTIVTTTESTAVLPTATSAYLTPVSTIQSSTPTLAPMKTSAYLTPVSQIPTTQSSTQTLAPMTTSAYLTPVSQIPSPTTRTTTRPSTYTSRTSAYITPVSAITSPNRQITTPKLSSPGFSTPTLLVNVESSSTMITLITSDTQGVTSTTTEITSASETPPQSTKSVAPQQFQNLRKPNLLLTGDNTTKARRWAPLFLPIILAIIVRQVWAITAANLKMMEPFYQLNRPDGAGARRSLMDDHLGGVNSLNTFSNALRGGILSITVIVVSLVVDLLAPISTGSMTSMAMSHYYTGDGTYRPFNPGWVLNLFFVRLLEAMLVFFLFVVVLIAIFDRRRQSGLSANPSKIATMASLLHDPNMINDLHRIPLYASSKEVEASVAHNRYRIASRQDSEGNSIFSLVKVSEVTPHGMHRVPLDMSVNDEEQHRIEAPIWYRLVDVLLIFLIVGILATVIGYWLDGSDSGFNQFFNSRDFAPRFVLSLGASVTTTAFQTLEREVRLTTPYRLLAGGHFPSRKTVLRAVNGTEISGLVRGIRYGAIFPTFVAFVTLLSNVLVVVISGVPFNEGITYDEFTFSASFSVAVATIMFGTAIAIFFWRRKNKRLRIPHEPNRSLLAMWMSVSNSKNQLRDILKLSDVSEDSLKDTIERNGGLYTASWILDDRGRKMWCVDGEFPFVQTNFTTTLVDPNRGAELEENPYAQATYRHSRASRRQDMSQSLPFIQTEYRETPIRRPEQTEHSHQEDAADIGRRSHYHEERFPHIQSEYRDRPAARPEGTGQVYPYSPSNYDESDISDQSNLRQTAPRVQSHYRRRESAGQRRITEGTHLLDM